MKINWNSTWWEKRRTNSLGSIRPQSLWSFRGHLLHCLIICFSMLLFQYPLFHVSWNSRGLDSCISSVASAFSVSMFYVFSKFCSLVSCVFFRLKYYIFVAHLKLAIVYTTVIVISASCMFTLIPVSSCCQHYTSADTCLSAFKAPLDPSTALGGFSGNNYSKVKYSSVTYIFEYILILWWHSNFRLLHLLLPTQLIMQLMK